MANRFDVVIVGARIAGSTLATHLARRGFSVCLVDRARFPSDTLSTHIFQDLPALERLGVLDRLLATGAPLLTDFLMRIDDVDLSQPHPDMAALCVRRRMLDQILLENAILRPPSRVMTPLRLFGATGRLLLRGEGRRRDVLGAAKSVIALGLQRQRLNKRPRFEEGPGSPGSALAEESDVGSDLVSA